ncbi:MAG: energy-coupling factor transporter transmembrane protein EcfT [Deltaproteobacteria bacterium]|nr:energy-coupling factor transporter transmembrane protein EcfT [Deltaproteobacteria bacterium]
MSLLDDITLGRFYPRDSILHRLDPRVKLAVLPLFVIASFSGSTFSLQLLLGGTAFLLICLARISFKVWWRGIWIFRWLFLFTLLLHLLLSPGRTLLGLTWLSRDGLLQGVLVCLQLTLAVTFSSLITLTTPPSHIASALLSFLSPLSRIGVPAKKIAFLFRLVLDFIPVLREEGKDLILECGYIRNRDDHIFQAVQKKIQVLRKITPLLLHRLVERADKMALAYAQGEISTELEEPLAPLTENRDNVIALILGLLFLALFFIGMS